MKTAAFILVLWTIPSIYLGLSGLCTANLEEEINKLDQNKDTLTKIAIDRRIDSLPPFKNKYDYDYYMAVSRYERVFPLVRTIPSFFGLVLTSMAFGVAGAVARIVLGIARGEYRDASSVKYLSQPFLGLFVGLCVLGISYLVPNVLAFNTGSIRPITLMFFSLFCGIYSTEFFERLANIFSKFFKPDRP